MPERAAGAGLPRGAGGHTLTAGPAPIGTPGGELARVSGNLPQPMVILAPALAAAVGLGIGVVLGRLGRSKIIDAQTALEEEIARLENQARDQSRQVSKLRGEQ